MDLKFLKDAAGTNYVVLSMVDAGTSWHQAIFLKNRSPKHVATKIVDLWITHYGAPEQLIHDQGGEFEGACQTCLLYTSPSPRD